MKNFIIIIIAIWLTSCSNSQPYPKFLNDLVQKQNTNYKEEKNEYFKPQEIFSHFPDNVLESYPISTNISLDNQYNTFCLMSLNNNPNFLNKIEKMAKRMKVDNFNSSDTAKYFVLPNDPYYRTEKLFFSKVPIPDFRLFDNIPFVNYCDTIEANMAFDMYFSNNFLCGLNNNYDIYIIDNQNIYNQKSNKYKELLSTLTHTKNVGFSQGICINKKVNSIFFWTIIF